MKKGVSTPKKETMNIVMVIEKQDHSKVPEE
jgi:hypothetical protein